MYVAKADVAKEVMQRVGVSEEADKGRVRWGQIICCCYP